MSSLLPSRRHLTNFLSRVKDIYKYSSHYRENPVLTLNGYADNIERLIDDTHPNRHIEYDDAKYYLDSVRKKI
jgi:hypothetical protein